MPGANYTGTATMAGKKCNTWTVTSETGTDILYLEVTTNTPVAMQLQSDFLYYYQDWQAGAPAMTAFQLPNDKQCPPSSAKLSKEKKQHKTKRILYIN